MYDVFLGNGRGVYNWPMRRLQRDVKEQARQLVCKRQFYRVMTDGNSTTSTWKRQIDSTNDATNEPDEDTVNRVADDVEKKSQKP